MKLILALLISFYSTFSYAMWNHPLQMNAFIKDAAKSSGYSRLYLTWLFMQAKVNPLILQKMQNPQEHLNWNEYRRRFLTEKRIRGGMIFWQKNRNLLMLEEQIFGVPAEIIVAILGMETNYGTDMGKFRAFDTLATLAFYYPKRSAFYRRELKNYLILCKTAHLNPLSIYGSYAGALGQTQFMPSSYLIYGYSTHNKKVANLFNDSGDAIFSIGNYLTRNGWRRDQPIVASATTDHLLPADLTHTDSHSIKAPQNSVHQLTNLGISTAARENFANLKVNYLVFAGIPDEHYLGFTNFYILTRYNNSVRYAMAVYQLGETIRKGLSREHFAQ